MATYKVSDAEAPRPFTIKKGEHAGEESTMQKVTMRDGGGTEYTTILFGKEEAFVGDTVEAQMGEYNPTYKNYSFSVKSIKHGDNPPPNKQAEPKMKTESSGNSSGSGNDNLTITRLAIIKAVGQLFMGKGNEEDVGLYLSIADQMVEWATTGRITEPRINAAKRKEIVAHFNNNVEVARAASIRIANKPFLHMLTDAEAEDILMEDASF